MAHDSKSDPADSFTVGGEDAATGETELLPFAEPWPPRQHTTTTKAAEMMGLSRSRVQHLCQAYRARIEQEVHAGQDPQLAQAKHELRCRWRGMGKRTEYAPHLPSIESYPLQSEQHRGHPIGWRPPKPYTHRLTPEQDVRYRVGRAQHDQQQGH